MKKLQKPIRRRKVLEKSLQGIGVGMLTAFAPPLVAGVGKHVIVIGAGLAGLAAAWELSKARFQVTVLEARKRVGGRVLSVRSGFSQGQYGELGASVIGHRDLPSTLFL